MGTINFDIKKTFKGAKKATEFNKIIESIAEREGKEIIDRDLLKRNQDWSKLSNQVVGAEI